MSLKCTNGFIVNDIKTRRIKSQDAKKYGISETDWKRVDADKNGEIDGSEFIRSGLNSLKLFQAFKGLNGDDYSEKFGNNTFSDKQEAINFQKSESPASAQKTQQTESPWATGNITKTQNGQKVKETTHLRTAKTAKKGEQEPFKDMTKSLFSFTGNNQYSLTHPNIEGRSKVAEKFDFLA